MAFLTVPTFGDVPVALEKGAAERDTTEVGGRRRAYSGAMHSTIRARKRSWPVRTRPMLLADADSLEAALEAAPPLACSGDLLGGATSCHYEARKASDMNYAGGRRRVLEFTLHEQ